MVEVVEAFSVIVNRKPWFEALPMTQVHYPVPVAGAGPRPLPRRAVPLPAGRGGLAAAGRRGGARAQHHRHGQHRAHHPAQALARGLRHLHWWEHLDI